MGALTAAVWTADPIEQLQLRILKLESRYQRERTARLQAEEIAERGLRDLYERKRQLELLESIATSANANSTLTEAFSSAVEAICAHTGWSFGHVYMMNVDSQRLEPTRMWTARDPERLAAFIERTQATEFTFGDGLPGRVLAARRAVWVDNVAADPTLPRCHVAADCGLHAAFAFPILIGSDVRAVMEFFHRDAQTPDEQLMAVMEQAGTQLGRVIERRVAEQKLIHDATHDSLTGLPNRMLFLDRLDRAVEMYKRSYANRYAVLFIDVDRFKLVNDSLGHAAGDVLLKEIASRLLECMAKSGSGMNVTLARLGGDEFTILLEGYIDEDDAADFAEGALRSFDNAVTIAGQKIYVSASIGIASCSTNYSASADIMRDADLAMYRAKSSGRGRVELFDQVMHDSAMHQLSMESDLRDALANEEFVLHYQPIMSLSDRTVTGFEALVRWQRSATGKIVAPDDFIKLAEDTGLIVFIGEWIMCEAFRTLVGWQRAGLAAADLTISVNVSPRQFHQTDFIKTVRDAIATTGIEPRCIRFEVTEGVAIVDAERAGDILRELRSIGIRVSIDDFGTGYSSLSYLHNLPFDVLKIDRSFIAAIGEHDGHDMVRTILDLARTMGLEVVAEGTETEAHVDLLALMGCGYAQGYYFSRPIDGETAARLLEAAIPPQAARTIAQ